MEEAVTAAVAAETAAVEVGNFLRKVFKRTLVQSLSEGSLHAHISTREDFFFAAMVHNGCVKYGAMLGWGIVIYAVMALAWSGLVLYGFSSTFAARLVQLLVLVATATIAGRSLRLHQWLDILPYSISWLVVVAVLDVVYSSPFIGFQIYTDWNLWVGYGLVVVVPLLAPYTRPTLRVGDDV